MAQPTRVQEGFGGARLMDVAGIGRGRRSIGSLPSPWEQARRAGVVADIGNVTTRVAVDTARQDYLAVYDPEALRRVAAGETIEDATDYVLRVTKHGGELLVTKMAKDAEEDVAASSSANKPSAMITAELPAEELSGRELVGAGVARSEG